MRIAFFGSSLVSAYWNGAATYYRGIVRALHARGHRVTFYEPDAFERQRHRDMPDPDWADIVVYPALEDAAIDAVASAAGADLVVKASGVGVFDDLLEEAVLELRHPQTLVAFWDVDAPATLDRLAANPADRFARLVPRYDIVLTFGGGQPVVSGYRALGARECVPIYNALDPETHYAVAPDPRFAADLSFLGNRLPDREARVEEFLLRAARLAPERSFLLGGSGWAERELPRNVRYVGHVFTRDHNAFHGTPRLALNASRDSMARYGYSPATRLLEAAGAAACIVTDPWPGIEAFLEPEREVLVAQDGVDVARFARGVDEPAARTIGLAARRRVLSEHTYVLRAAQLEALFEGRGPARPGAAA
jgi:spore maturation protein CgeB